LVLCVLAYSEPGDKILVQSPVYFPFFSSIENHKRILINNQLIDNNGEYSMDFDDLEKKFKQGIKLMMFCHPHNPVGKAWRREDLKKLSELAIKYNVVILSDEIHSDLLLFGHKHMPLASLGDEIASRTITCIAPSKTFNLAGLHTSAIIIENIELKARYEKLLDEIHVGGGNLFGAVALESAYNKGDDWLDQLLTYLEGNFTFLKDYIYNSGLNIRVSPLEATYLAWLNFESYGMNDNELMKFMISKVKIAFLNGPRFGAGGEQYLRMNIATPRSVLKSAMEQLSGALKS